MCRRYLLIGLLSPLLFSCYKPKHCSVPVFPIPAAILLHTTTMNDIDTVLITEWVDSSGKFEPIKTMTGAELKLTDGIITPSAGSVAVPLAAFWAGRSFQVIIPGRHGLWNISDISFEGDTVIYFDTDSDCDLATSYRMREPKSFKVNGVRQESRVIHLDF